MATVIQACWLVLCHNTAAALRGTHAHERRFLTSGVCAHAGLHTWAVVLIVFACLGVVAGAGYAAYRLRLRSAMHQEIRAIMAQYMPLESQVWQQTPLSPMVFHLGLSVTFSAPLI